MLDYKKFWIGDKLQNIASESYDILENWPTICTLHELRNDLGCQSVLDFGCGVGRFFPAFRDREYWGVDLNPLAISTAKQLYPDYAHYFLEVGIHDEVYPKADLVLAFTVFLHLDDITLSNILTRVYIACKKHLVIVECLGREWKDPQSILPKFNRDLEDYITLVCSSGFEFEKETREPNPQYAGNDAYYGKNTDTSFLTFRKV